VERERILKKSGRLQSTLGLVFWENARKGSRVRERRSVTSVGGGGVLDGVQGCMGSKTGGFKPWTNGKKGKVWGQEEKNRRTLELKKGLLLKGMVQRGGTLSRLRVVGWGARKVCGEGGEKGCLMTLLGIKFVGGKVWGWVEKFFKRGKHDEKRSGI